MDGVLNCAATFQDKANRVDDRYFLDPAMVARLDRVLAATGATVIVSSCWRRGDNGRYLRQVLERAGLVHFDRIVDETPIIGASRGAEIHAYLATRTELPDRIAIVDDDDDFGYLRDHLARTTWAAGLTDDVADLLIEALGRIPL